MLTAAPLGLMLAGWCSPERDPRALLPLPAMAPPPFEAAGAYRGPCIKDEYRPGRQRIALRTVSRYRDGLLIREETDEAGDGVLEGWHDYEYRQGRLVAETEVRAPRGGMRRHAHVYDAQGRRIESRMDLDARDQPRSRIGFEYDARGLLAARTFDRRPFGSPDQRTTYAYDAAGRLVREVFIGRMERPAAQPRTTLYAYDVAGRQVSRTTENPARHIQGMRFETTYDDAGNRASEDQFIDGRWEWRWEYACDRHGNLTRSAEYQIVGGAKVPRGHATYWYGCWR